ncbi:alanine racemase [Nocardiopsis coralliicola]
MSSADVRTVAGPGGGPHGLRAPGSPVLPGLGRLAAEHADERFKGLPPDAAHSTVGALAAQGRSLFTGGFTTPVLALSAERTEHNLALMRDYSERHGLAFAPHGKTSMAPQLFDLQLRYGAWGITLAAPHQVRVARRFGVARLFLANELVDAAALRWLAAELDADPDFSFACYVDSVRGVRLMDEALRAAGARRPVDVVVELGAGEGTRTGVRSAAEADRVAAAAAEAPALRPVGVAGYEGEVPGATPERVAAWLRQLTRLTAQLDADGRFAALGPGEPITVSAGGSAWFDAVAAVFSEPGGPLESLSRPVRKLLRSGAYVTHDDGLYRERTPFNRVPGEGELQSAFTLWAQVVSRPETGQAFLNAGRRDASFDQHLPRPHLVRPSGGGPARSAEGIAVTSLSDQHAWVSVDEGAELEVGDWVGLSLSHPCTVFDKWQLIPAVRDDGTVVDLIRTFF